MILIASILAALCFARALWLALEISEERRRAWRSRHRV